MLRPSILLLILRSGILRLIYRLMTDSRVPLRAKLIVPAAIIYLIVPFDIVPDIVPIAGLLDDILALIISIGLFVTIVPREVLSEHLGRSGRSGGASPPKGPCPLGTLYRPDTWWTGVRGHGGHISVC